MKAILGAINWIMLNIIKNCDLMKYKIISGYNNTQLGELWKKQTEGVYRLYGKEKLITLGVDGSAFDST